MEVLRNLGRKKGIDVMNARFQKGKAKTGATIEVCRNLINEGQLQHALVLLTQRLKESPEDKQWLKLTSDCYWEMRRTEQSMMILQWLLEQDPHDVTLLSRRGSRLLSLGEKSAAKQAFEAALQVKPDEVALICALHVVDPLSPESPQVNRLKRAAKARKTPEKDRESALNTLGSIASREGDFAQAMEFFQASKDCIAMGYDSAALEALVESQVETFKASSLQVPASNRQKSRPLFITGVPRSGTTLLETMLASHSAVATVGESTALQVAKAHIRDECGGSEANWSWCENLSELNREKARTLYLKGISNFLTELKPWIIDKMPRNIFELGFAAQAMPEARFVYMKRHPLDVGLSLLSNNFAGNTNEFTKSQERIAHYILQSEKSADDMKSKLGCSFRMQSYREIVDNSEMQLREILAFLELPLEESVFNPEASPIMVKTASVAQVRQGVNRKGLGRWHDYEDFLQPLIHALGGWDWIHAWEEQDRALWT